MSAPCLAQDIDIVVPARARSRQAIEVAAHLWTGRNGEVAAAPKIIVSAFGVSPNWCERQLERCAGGFAAHIPLTPDPIWAMKTIYVFVRVYVGELLVAYETREVRLESRVHAIAAVLAKRVSRRRDPYVIYAHADWADVEPRLEGMLIGARLDVDQIFLDALTLPNGLPWRMGEVAHLRQAKEIVIFWSEAASRSKEVKAEIDLAYHLFRKAGRPALSFAPLDDTPPPAEWSDLQFSHRSRWLRTLNQRRRERRDLAPALDQSAPCST